MKILKIILIVLVAITAIFISVYAYYGGFHSIEFRTKEQGGEILVYEDVVGDYSQTVEIADQVFYSLLNDFNIETFRGFGIYYDNPAEVEASILRSKVGRILEDADSAKMELIGQKFKVKTLPKGTYTMTEFPYKGMMSILVGLMKVYPEMHKQHAKGNIEIDGPIMEIYDVPNKKIIYRILKGEEYFRENNIEEDIIEIENDEE